MRGWDRPLFRGLSVRGSRLVLAGAASVAAGLALLVYCDPEGGNWAAKTSPFLTMGGYGAMLLGIFLDDPGRTQG